MSKYSTYGRRRGQPLSAGEQEMLRVFKEIFTFSDDHKYGTTEYLLGNKERSIRQTRRSTYVLPDIEVITLKDGRTKEVKLVYNTKQTSPENEPLAKKYKTALCVNHPHCPYGDGCRYAHGEGELNMYSEIQQCYREYCELANNFKVGKLDHHELCQNQQCAVRLRILLKKTVICHFWKDDCCKKDAHSCTYAHGERDLKPLPKHELCKKFLADECNLQNSECVYAHGKIELRQRGGKKVRTTVDITYSSDGESIGSSLEDDSENTVAGHRLCPPCQFLDRRIPARMKPKFFTFL